MKRAIPKEFKEFDIVKTKIAPYAGRIFLLIRSDDHMVWKDVTDTGFSFQTEAIWFKRNNIEEYIGNLSVMLKNYKLFEIGDKS